MTEDEGISEIDSGDFSMHHQLIFIKTISPFSLGKWLLVLATL